MRSSVLSDKKVIEELKKRFIVVELNITDDGFPKEVPGLKPWETAYNANKMYNVAFATSVVLGPTGKWAFGSSGSGHSYEAETAANYHADRFLKFLNESHERYDRAVKIEGDKSLSDAERKVKLSLLQLEILKMLQKKPAASKE
jgi:hypothetical protein